MADSPVPSPLDADDPRISEWIDGRLTPSEAAAIERAVAESSELTLLVDDLRTIQKAMRSTSGDTPPVDLGDRIMAALTSSNGAVPHRALASRRVAPAPSKGRRLPWLGLLGALAAGVLVTVVINLPNDNGREIALAPEPEKKHDVVAETAKGLAIGEKQGAQRSIADRRSTDTLERADDANGFADLLQRSRRDGAEEALASDEAAFSDAPASAASSPVPGEAIAGNTERFHASNAVAAPTFAGGGRGQPPEETAAPAPSAVAPTPPPTVVAAPAGELKETEALDTVLAKQESARESGSAYGQGAKKMKGDLAGVLVIAVTNASERRTLDRLVAESGLEATPEKDHLALVGKTADVDAFLQELTRVGLVSAVPARRAAEAGKLKADERSDARNTTLIVRVVERRGKSSAPVQAGEGEAKP